MDAENEFKKELDEILEFIVKYKPRLSLALISKINSLSNKINGNEEDGANGENAIKILRLIEKNEESKEKRWGESKKVVI